MSHSVVNRCQAVMSALPPDVLAIALMADEDPLAAACLPHPAVIACVRGAVSESEVAEAEAWLASRPLIQGKAAMLADLLAADLARYGDDGLPGWVGSYWSAIVRCPWAQGLDSAVAEGEAFFALV